MIKIITFRLLLTPESLAINRIQTAIRRIESVVGKSCKVIESARLSNQKLSGRFDDICGIEGFLGRVDEDGAQPSGMDVTRR